ncbi:hypothetical protein [Pelosinus sp. UFO1]|nr:hypothetical protein [Pelosinus sp. UFO1]AIF49703.1 hypothetical protein UFO1_0142 [Pelosinus sp. UFO1]
MEQLELISLPLNSKPKPRKMKAKQTTQSSTVPLILILAIGT